MSLHLITPATEYPLTVTQVRSRLKIDSAAEDPYIQTLITELTGLIDGGNGLIGRALCRQTWEYRLPGFGCGPIQIPLPPLVSISSVKYLDTTATEQTVSSADYVLIDQGDLPSIVQPVLGKMWPITACNRPDAVRIQFLCGYLTASIPPHLTGLMLREIGKALQTRDADLSPDYSEIIRYRAIALPPSTDAVL